MAPRSLCHTTAIAPVPAIPGGSCPLGCSLSAPATGGLSMVSPQYIRYAAGSEKEKRAGGRLHGGIIAHSFEFYKGGVAEASPEAGGRDWGRAGLLWPAPPFRGWSGLACAATPPAPPTDVFQNRGTPPGPPAEHWVLPAPSFGRRVRSSPGIAGDTLYSRWGRSPLHPAWGTAAVVFSHLARWDAS